LHIHSSSSFIFTYHRPPSHLHSFPTRRSSDLTYRRAASRERIRSRRSLPPHRSTCFAPTASNTSQTSWSGASTTMMSATCSKPSDRKSTRLNSSHLVISYAVFCLKKKKHNTSD